MNRVSQLGGGIQLTKFVLLLTASLIHGWLTRPQTLLERGRWRQKWCRIILRGLDLHVETTGSFPASGLLACNHLSYLDALVLGALTPAVFVSKSEVRHWPMIGGMCARGGTIFLQRERARDAVRTNQAVADALRSGLPVAIFPEGTTTDGLEPLPFHPALFQPAIAVGVPVWPLALSYWFADGSDASARVAYFGDVKFVPHVLQFMRLRSVHASVQIAPAPVAAPHRVAAAQQSWSAVTGLLKTASAVACFHRTDSSTPVPQAVVTQLL